MRRTHLTILGLAMLSLAVYVGCQPMGQTSAEKPNAAGYLIATDDENVAVKGYDVVSYFTDEQAAEGSADFTTNWHGADWRFSSQENLDKFKADPEAYAPQYGGYCAWGVAAKNSLFEIDPTAWRIVDGKLYLNFNADVQKQWLEDVPGFIESGDENWVGLSAKPAS